MEDEFADDGAVSGDVAGALAAVIFAKDDVLDPVQAFYNTPVPPHMALKSRSGRLAAAQVMPGFGRGHTRGSGRARGHDFDQGLQPDPLGAAQRSGQAVIGQDPAGVGFHPPMGGLFAGRGCRLGANGKGGGEGGFDRRVQHGLVAFQGQQVLDSGNGNDLAHAFLTADGIHRQQAAIHVEQDQQVGQGRDFVGLVRGLVLAQAQAGLVALSVEQLHGRGPALRMRGLLLPGRSGAEQALTIEANLRAVGQPHASLNPRNKTLFKAARFEPAHPPVERVVRWNARRKRASTDAATPI